MKQIYILYSCNAWKERHSMCLIMATTSINKLKNTIVSKIEDETICYIEEEDEVATQIERFKEDWKRHGMKYTLDNLEYGYVEIVSDGGIQ